MVSSGRILPAIDGSYHRSTTRGCGAFAFKVRIPAHPDRNSFVPLFVATWSFEERSYAEESRLDLVELLSTAWITEAEDS